jgi:hypothetical protein
MSYSCFLTHIYFSYYAIVYDSWNTTFINRYYLFIVQSDNSDKRGHVTGDLRGINQFFGILSFILISTSCVGFKQDGDAWSQILWIVPLFFWLIAGIVIYAFGPRNFDYNKTYRDNEITKEMISPAFPFHYIEFPWGKKEFDIEFLRIKDIESDEKDIHEKHMCPIPRKSPRNVPAKNTGK